MKKNSSFITEKWGDRKLTYKTEDSLDVWNWKMLIEGLSWFAIPIVFVALLGLAWVVLFLLGLIFN